MTRNFPPSVRRYLIASAVYGMLISVATIASAWVLAHLVAGVITDPATRTAAHWSGQLLILLGLWTVRTIGSWLQARLSQRAATAVIGELGAGVLRSVTARSPHDLLAVRDETAVILTRGLDGLRPYFTGYLPAVVLAGILTPMTVIVIAATDLQAAIIVAIALPLVPLFMILIGKLTADRSAAALAAMTTLQSRLLDLVAGIPTLRALGRAAGPAHRIAELAAAHRRSAMATLRIAFLSAAVLELLATLGVALVAVSVGLRLVFGEMTLAAGLTALLLAPEVFWPLRRVGVQFHAAQDGKTAADAAMRLQESAPPRAPGHRTARGDTIRLEELSVVGRDGPAPDRLTATAVAGEVTVFTGPNGCGKSTTFEAILGLTAASSGRVLAGDVDIAEADLQTWWPQVSWLPQRPVLIPGTVRANLELFGPLPDVDHACRAAGFDEVLARLPEGVDTVIGRGGVGLSLGQRQRLGLARALGSAAQVLLLDEPTAHLDADTERRVLEALSARAREGATVIVIGHRAPVLAAADHIVAVEGALHVPS